MKEEFLYYIWQYKMFSSELVTTNDEKVTIIRAGSLNKDSGPDFLNAQIKINNQTWAGNIEIHLKSSDWYIHKHEADVNYDAVILHVVYENDAEVFMKNNQPIPTLELNNKIDKKLLENYQNLFSKQLRWIPCEKQITKVDTFLLNNWLERLYFERLENKASLIKELLQEVNNDFEAVLFQLFAKNFGLKVNRDAFLHLAKSFNFSVLRKESFDEFKLSALLFGQSGFLEDDVENGYHQQLKKEYEYLKYKYQLKSISNNQFQFFRMRPNNFPTIRIAQLVALYHQHQNLFSKLMEIERLEDFYTLFSIHVNDFWKTHYTFEKESKKKSSKKLTKSFIDLLIINTIVPLKFVFEQSRGKVDGTQILKLIQQLKPESNSIISKFSDLKIKGTNAFETQALLELKNNYCNSKRCLECAIGNSLLRQQKKVLIKS